MIKAYTRYLLSLSIFLLAGLSPLLGLNQIECHTRVEIINMKQASQLDHDLVIKSSAPGTKQEHSKKDAPIWEVEEDEEISHKHSYKKSNSYIIAFISTMVSGYFLDSLKRGSTFYEPFSKNTSFPPLHITLCVIRR